MSLTLGDYIGFITPKVGQSDANSVNFCRIFLRNRYKMIYDMMNWNDATDLITGLSVGTTGIMAYPSTIDRIIAIRAGGDHILVPTDSAYLMQVDPTIFEQTGMPLRWEDIGGHQIAVYPTPTASVPIILQGKRVFTQLVADTDSPVLRNIDQALIAYGTADMLQRQRQYNKAQMVLQEAAAALDAMTKAETARAGYQARIVPYVEDFGDTAFDRTQIGVTSAEFTTESGITQLVNGQAFIHVNFLEQKASAAWTLTDSSITNTVDGSPLSLFTTTITSQTVSGFTVSLNGAPNSNNYYLHWTVSL